MVSIYELGSNLLDLLEQMHCCGYVHNDLTLDKIVLGPNQLIPPQTPKQKNDATENMFSDKSVHIVDF